MRYHVPANHHANGISCFWLVVSLTVLFVLAVSIASGQVVPPAPNTRPSRDAATTPRAEDESGVRLIRRSEKAEENPSFRGRIAAIEDTSVTVDRQDIDQNTVIEITKETKVTINGGPTKLESLRQGDYVEVFMSPSNPETIVDLKAGRPTFLRIGDPSDREGSQRDTGRQRQATERLNQQSGLGLVMSDSPDQGLLIVLVRQNTPAWIAGMQAGDYLMEIQNRRIETPDDYIKVLDELDVQDEVSLKVWREGKLLRGSSKLASADIARDVIVDNGLALLLNERGIERTSIDLRSRSTPVSDPRTPILDDDPDLNRTRDPAAVPQTNNQNTTDRVRQLEQENRRLRQQRNNPRDIRRDREDNR